MKPAPAGRSRAPRTLLLYVILVGLPVAGLLGILRVGRALTPPPAIGGEWTVRTALPAGLPESCAALLRPAARQPALALSQSGVYLSLTFRGERATTTLDGRLRGDSLFADAAPRSRPASRGEECDVRDGLRLDAALESESTGGPARLDGTLAIAGCGGCAPARLTAVRDPAAPRSGTGGH